MLLSIIVPVYNVKDYVEKCLESIGAQTNLNNYEVIVVDDGSTDGSGEIVDDFCKDKENFRVIHKQNGGLMSAWTEGVKNSNGEYIGFVDSDDYVAPEMYSSMLKKATEYNSDIVLCNHYYVNKQYSEEHRNPIEAGYYSGDKLKKIHPKMFPSIGNDYISPSRCNKVIKKEVLLKNIKYCDPSVTSGEDVNIMVPCLLSCKSLYYINKPFYYYVMRQSSISNKFNERLIDSYKILIKKITQAVNDYNISAVSESENLYNVYGLLWSKYVAKSSLKYNEKCKQLKRLLKDKNFIEKVDKISSTSSFTIKAYKLMVKLKMPFVFILFFIIFKTVYGLKR